jgi:hypothetical protein
VITRADIDSGRPDEAGAMLTGMVVPATKAAAGFVLLESRAAASAAAKAQGSGPPPAPRHAR